MNFAIGMFFALAFLSATYAITSFTWQWWGLWFMGTALMLGVAISRYLRENSKIRLTLTSDGTTGRGWIEYFKSREIPIDEKIKEFLLSKKFRPTNNKKYSVLIRRIRNRHLAKLIQIVYNKKNKPNIEVVCLFAKLGIVDTENLKNNNYHTIQVFQKISKDKVLVCFVSRDFFNPDKMEIHSMEIGTKEKVYSGRDRGFVSIE